MKYLHTMIRVSYIEDSLRFFCDGLGLIETRRKEMSQNMFKAQMGDFEEAPHNEPKPEIADTGTFAPDGSVINNSKETKIDMDLRDENNK